MVYLYRKNKYDIVLVQRFSKENCIKVRKIQKRRKRGHL